MKLFDRHFICIFCNERKRVEDGYIKTNRIGICKSCNKRLGRFRQPRTMSGGISVLISPFEYREPLRHVMLKYKFDNHWAYAELFAEMMRECVMSYDIWQDADFIIPVPLHKSRLRERGYNQSELIAKFISDYTGARLNTSALERIRATQRQSELEGLDRVRNVEGAFYCTEDMRGRSVVIFDDICTTGSTLISCAEALINAGVHAMCALTFAFQPQEKIAR